MPVSYMNGSSTVFKREIENRTAIIDNLIELIVFTPRGSFLADDDFGFEYWNHEYSNMNIRNFNNGQNGIFGHNTFNEITKIECQESIKRSIEAYYAQLKQIDVSIELQFIDMEQIRTIASKYQIIVKVTGLLDDGLGTYMPYCKEISFLMEPTVKRYKI